MADDQATQTRKKTRSPNFPSIDLKAAIELLTKLYKVDGRNAAFYADAVGHWGYKPTSSSAMRAVGALNAYGLVTITGTGDDRKIAISARGRDIVEDEQEESESRDKAIRDAALAPALHREVWEEYGPALPSDATFRSFLLRSKEFNPNSTKPFIEQYKATFSFAKLGSAGTMDEVEDDESGDGEDASAENAGGDPKTPKHKGKTVNHTFTPPPAGVLPLPVLMDDGTFQVVNIPKMTATAFAFFKSQLEAYKAAIIQQPANDQDVASD